MHIFVEIGLILAVATVISIVMRMLRQPLVVGYILSGIILGPYFLDLIKSTEYIELFSKLGIAILLFIVGLNLRPDVIREVGKVSLITGIGQIVVTSVVGFVIMKFLGFNNLVSLYGSVALTFSSTIIILKLLSDKGDLDKLYGKISVGFLLVQDIAATIILLAITILGSTYAKDGSDIDIASLILRGVIFFLILYLSAKYVLPKITGFLAKSQESLFLFSLTWGLGMSGIFYIFGFSLEIGALAAGVALSMSPFSLEISSRTKPLRDFFILLFFVLLGSQMALANFGEILLPAIILSLFVLIGNPIIVIILMNLLGYTSRTGFLAGLTVAQISEFSLILMALGFSFGHVDSLAVSLITLVGIITIAGSTYLVIYADDIYPRIKFLLKFLEFKKQTSAETKDEKLSPDIIIFGYDRAGYDVVNTAQKMSNKYLVVDFNPHSIQKLKDGGVPHRFGDAKDADFLYEIGVPNAKAVISTIPDFKTNLSLVTYYHNYNPTGIIIVVSHHTAQAKELYENGASFVVMPHYLGAQFVSKIIETHNLEADKFEKEKVEHLDYLEKKIQQ